MPARKKTPKPGDSPVKTIQEICDRVGIARRTYHYWSALPEFPKGGSPAERLAFVEAKANGRYVGDDAASEPQNATDWRVEKEKWQALKNKQSVEQERLKIVLSARDDLLAGIAEVLERMRKKVGRATKNDPAMAEAINKAYLEAVAELTAMQSGE